MYRLPGERRPLRVMEGPYADAACVVQDIGSDAIQQTAGLYVVQYAAADGWLNEQPILSALYDLFIQEAEPAWTIADHKGLIPATKAGIWRLPVDLALEFVSQWIQPLSSAVDELIPPGPLRDALNDELRASAEE